MSWIRILEGNYLLRLTDGYVQGSGNSAVPAEADFARRLYRLAKRPHDGVDGNPQPPNPLHIWIIGSDGWPRGPPEPVRSVCEGETRDDYRMVITGEGLQGLERPYMADWSSWLYSSGMRRKKRHRDLKRYQLAGGTLLGVMHDFYDETGLPPTNILTDLDVPVTFIGDRP